MNGIPTGIQAGNAGSLFSAPATVTLTFGTSYLIPGGSYYTYGQGADMDLEIITATVPTWTKIRDGADTQPLGIYIYSDGVSLRYHNTHASATQTAQLITVD